MKEKNIKFTIPSSYALSPTEIHTLIEIIKKNMIASTVEIPDVKTYKKAIPNIKALVFDVYGTLLHSSAGEINENSEKKHNRFIIKELSLSVDYLSVQKLIKNYVEQQHASIKKTTRIKHPEICSISMWKTIAKNESLFYREISNYEAAICAVYYELYNNPATPMPYATDILEYLHQNNYVLGIVSNAQFYTPLFLEACFSEYPFWQDIKFLLQTWSYILSEAKPSVVLFKDMLAQAQKIGLKTDEIIYIGNDKKNDIYPPSQLSIHSTLFAGDAISYRPRENDPLVSSCQPSAIISSLLDIKDIIS